MATRNILDLLKDELGLGGMGWHGWPNHVADPAAKRCTWAQTDIQSV